MSKLKYRLMLLTKRNKEGSYSTQSNRRASLCKCADELEELGYKFNDPKSLKPKHVDALVEFWKTKNMATGTIKNRMSHIRWWAEKINKKNIVLKGNAQYCIEKRVYATNVSKAQKLDVDKLESISCDFVKASLKLQQEFGLRREEAIKFDARYAVQNDHIRLKGTWCKGGKPRVIKIDTDGQREALNYIGRISPNGCLIPRSKNYVQQLRRYESETMKAKMSKMHGLRHAFAQRLYEKLTGWKCPIKGGIKRRDLTEAQRDTDNHVRLIISRALGHERIAITVIYLGS